jgi:SAM-dependent methyltransferase
VQANELRDRIAGFPTWQYEFEFDGGVRTPVADRSRVRRQEQRRRYFFDALLGVTGGSLKGRRVLDLGCNAGFFSLQAIEAGADFVLGVDARESYIQQSELVFQAKGVDASRYRFEQGNLFEHTFQESFDTVLCLGLLSVVSKPVALFELMSRVGAELIVIDTGLSRFPEGFFEVSRLAEPRNAVDHEMVLVPTRQAVFDLAGQFGYDTVALARKVTDETSMQDYTSDRRLAFICSKGVPLRGVAVDEPVQGPLVASAARVGRHIARRLGG